MGRGSFRGVRGQSGQALIIAVTMVGLIILSGLSVFSFYSVKTAGQRAKFFRKFLVEEATITSFAMMESALRRRLWEAPPTNRCLKRLTMHVDGTVTNLGFSWKVSATYNPKTKVYTMLAEGKIGSLGTIDPTRATFQKQIKVLDSSDFLFFNVSPSSFTMFNGYRGGQELSGFLGGRRRIYTNGLLTFRPKIGVEKWENGFSDNRPAALRDYGLVVQADRIESVGGFSYVKDEPVYCPDNSFNTDLKKDICGTDMTAPPPGKPGVDSDGESEPKYYTQYGGGRAVITDSSKQARALMRSIKDNAPDPELEMDVIRRSTYPIALFGGDKGGLPLLSDEATDNGAYYDKVNKWTYFQYRAGINGISQNSNFTCLISEAATGMNRHCSYSAVYPAGFNKWRADADLDGALYTSETIPQKFDKIDWDNMEALEEDARVCGAVIEDTGPSYQDCQSWDKNFMATYAATGTPPECARYKKVDLQPSMFTNYTQSDVTDEANEDLILRRVIYSKVNVEYAQTEAKGIFTNLKNRGGRERMAVWMVGENLTNLRGFQLDKNGFSKKAGDPNSPFEVEFDPLVDEMREVVFNADARKVLDLDDNGKNFYPIHLVMLTPEIIHLVSEKYVPLSRNHFLDAYKVVDSRIRPAIPNFLDSLRYEDDAFKYGTRQYRVENVLVISNPAVSPEAFRLKGLWHALDVVRARQIRNGCAVNDPGADRPAWVGEEYKSGKHGTPLPARPLANGGSDRYWKWEPDPASPGNYLRKFPKEFVPTVFASMPPYSQVKIRGMRILTFFDETAPPGKRNLNVSNYAWDDRLELVNMDNKFYVWDSNSYYPRTEVPIPSSPPWAKSPCLYDQVFRKDGTTKDNNAFTTFYANGGGYEWQQISPPDTFKDSGALFGIELPVVQVSQ